MKKNKMIAAICCAGALAAVCAGYALAQSPTIQAGASKQETTVSGPAAAGAAQETDAVEEAGAVEGTEAAEGAAEQGVQSDLLCIWGTITNISAEESQITINNQSGVSYAGEIVLNIDSEGTRVLGAENGFPVQLSDLTVGETIYAYIGQAMTMSLPPMTNAKMIICKIPADFKAPEYVTVSSMTEKDGNWELVGTNGTTYAVPAACEILPYKTRNIVVLQDVAKDSKLLVWSDAENQATKLVLFAE